MEKNLMLCLSLQLYSSWPLCGVNVCSSRRSLNRNNLLFMFDLQTYSLVDVPYLALVLDHEYSRTMSLHIAVSGGTGPAKALGPETQARSVPEHYRKAFHGNILSGSPTPPFLTRETPEERGNVP
jgi:hypothetical protein